MVRVDKYDEEYYANQSGSGFIDTVQKVLESTNIIKSEFPGEKHMAADPKNNKFGKSNYNYLGPSTRLDIRLKPGAPKNISTPINPLDAQAKKHDLMYQTTGEKLKAGLLTRDEAIEEIHEADDVFIDNLKKISGNKLLKSVASKAIFLKKMGEKLHLIDENKFSISGAGKLWLPPDYKLRKEAQRGGFAVLPFLIPIVSSLAVEGVKKLYDFLTKKKSTTEQEGEGLDTKKKFIIAQLDKLPNDKQINLLHNVLK